MTSHKKRPEKSEIKGINLYDAEFHLVDGDEFVKSLEPKWVDIHVHMDKAAVLEMIDKLQETLSHYRSGTLIISFIGRPV